MNVFDFKQVFLYQTSNLYVPEGQFPLDELPHPPNVLVLLPLNIHVDEEYEYPDGDDVPVDNCPLGRYNFK